MTDDALVQIETELSPAREGTRVQLEALLADLSEGIITLGLDGTLHYANRAALTLHGVEALAELGGSVRAYQDRFELTDLYSAPLAAESYPLARIMRGESFADAEAKLQLENREIVHTYRGLVVLDTLGKPDFLALFVSDKTEHYDAEQRFERTFTANPSPALISRLADLRYIKVNRGFLEMTGFRREEIIGRTAYEFDVLAGVSGREAVLAKFHRGETILPQESYVDTRTGGKKFVVVGGQPLEVGREPCMLLTFIDLDARKKVEDALRQSEERFSKAFNLAPVATLIMTLGTGRILNLNEAFKRVTGYGVSDAIGRTTAELGLWLGGGEKHIETALARHHGYRDLELKLCTLSGEQLNILASAETIAIGDQTCVLCMFHDVTSWKRTETDLVEAINLALEDPTWFSRSVATKVRAVRSGDLSSEAAAKLARLTVRERQVLELTCQGLSGEHLAAELQISKNTVRNYLAALYKKLELHSRAELIVWAKRHEVMD